MNLVLPKRMTVDEFLVWAERQPKESGKLELLDGRVIVQQSQRWAHSKIKHQMAVQLQMALERAKLPFFAAPKGPMVRLGPHLAFEPDALVAPLPEPSSESLEISNPILVVEVLSPSTAQFDATTKLKGYFELPCLQHYLLVDPEGGAITHHKRAQNGIETRVFDSGTLDIDPPGFSISLDAIFRRGV